MPQKRAIPFDTSGVQLTCVVALRSSPERSVNRWPAGHAATLLGRLGLRLSAGGGSSSSSARNSLSW